MRKTVVLVSVLAGAALLLGAGCGGGDEDDTPPPPPVGSGPQGSGQLGQSAQGAPPGQVMVTVAAHSTPPGALVTGGGRQLGIAPLRTLVPVPAPRPGEVQTFAFTFELAGYQPATINASPVNNTISITAALAPAVQSEPGNAQGGGDGEPSELQVTGRGGGAIYDNHTTPATAEVEQ